jgi:chromosome segregation ATPase
MSETIATLQQIQDKIMAIQERMAEQKALLRAMEQEKEELELRLTEAEESLQQQNQAIVSAEAELETLRAENAQAAEQAKQQEEVKYQINELLKEVDRCIALMQNEIKDEVVDANID